MGNKTLGNDFYSASKSDWLIIGLVLLFSVGWLLWGVYSHMRQSQGTKEVFIYLGDKLASRVPLEKDRTIDLFDGKIQVDIRGGRARISKADCPKHSCMNSGWIKYSGQIIVCAPNKVLIEIRSMATPQFDAVTY